MINRFIYLLFLFLPFALFAQERIITGKITDSNGEGMPFAEVFVDGTSNGVVSGSDGTYSIKAKTNEILVFNFIGMTAQKIKIGDADVINVALQEGGETLDEVVVVGYGTTKKRDLTGSITSIKSDVINEQPALSALEAIQGKAAGIQIISDGEPGSTPVVRVRGTGTVEAGRDPLYVVDGILTDRIDNINSQDIATMDILKDASSLAIYGNRGANGVIIITTKKAMPGKTSIRVSSYFAVEDVLTKVKMADANSWTTFTNEYLAEDPNNELYPFPAEYNTDWFDELTTLGSVASHNIAVSGGNDKVRSYFSANFFDQQGILKSNDYRRVNLRSKSDYIVSEKLKFNHNVSFSISNRDKKPTSVFQRAYKQTGIIPVRYTSGDNIGQYGVSTGINNVGNPIRTLELTNNKIKGLTIQGSLASEYKLNSLITLNSSFGIESDYTKSFLFSGEQDESDPNFGSSDNITHLSNRRSDYTKWTFDFIATLQKTFAERHNAKLVVGTTSTSAQGEFMFAQVNNVPLIKDYWSLSNGEDFESIEGLRDTRVTQRSYLARLNYDFDHKYLLTATFRRDGSSYFTEDNRWGNFKSIGLGWDIAAENFLKDQKFINQLKLRGSWGELGNQNVEQQILTFTSGLNYAFGTNQDLAIGSTVRDIIDPSLGWEVTEEWDLGFEFMMFKNHLSGEFDFYDRLNKNAAFRTKNPSSTGVITEHFSNLARVRNKGYEVALHWNSKIGNDFKYHIGGNFSINENTLEDVFTDNLVVLTGGGLGQGGVITKRLEIGQPLGAWYLNTVTGIDQATGDFIYEDIDENGVIDADDRRYYGSSMPKSNYGVNLGFNYKNIDFNIHGYGNAGGYIYNGKKQQRVGGENIEQSRFDNRWTPENPTASGPRAFASDIVPSTYYLESSDFFRINNITLGYKLPNVISGIQNVRLYVQAKNPFIFTDYSGYTPELPGVDGGKGDPLGSLGLDLNAYPTTKSYIVGIDLNF